MTAFLFSATEFRSPLSRPPQAAFATSGLIIGATFAAIGLTSVSLNRAMAALGLARLLPYLRSGLAQAPKAVCSAC
ncbi:hypothetical protein [Pandoraea communis]|uniref:hypothetical protein n=1 Tax=Pandoraea communis TaxID=2508297 RepID=UPI0025A50282|nr:hypothetical protein [Pandoraea communis]MDM8356381.1 hypothetical protein [Pandoraea communis]